MASKLRVLMVLSSATKFTMTGKPTGWYLRKISPTLERKQELSDALILAEFAHPYTVLSEIADITVVSPKGGYSQVDPGSVSNTASTDAISHSFLRDREEIWTNTGKISDFVGKAKDFDAICCPGGHARRSRIVALSRMSLLADYCSIVRLSGRQRPEEFD